MKKPSEEMKTSSPAAAHARQRELEINQPERLRGRRAQGLRRLDEASVDADHDRQHGQHRERHHRMDHADHHAEFVV